ncbi:hypothetical protein EMIHUDRAFT_112279 [Emiliania huxleyi CCMP1516]|uniref:WWE domain-containing protein n=2 Tax=Emiliania huxleyi TaxID=2903 RepID=A0A0D3K9Y8_EMIH1|nr:hypothetical protein EMIHUDRAFT_112279 [Emiliania huxleyi CCMP1516]EOD32573.1 hypothetical protein EMIHUDRAFT_112279 [Emiliania huxleyi CCMP1516]|eukprot:XP_005785002.1 hypothetical protein EMIHUDRAFT_112279 [Emiliania huxleyi CCMP1516]
MTSTLRNIRLGFAQEAAATRVQRAMRAFLLNKGTIIITILITKIQAAARGLNTRTSLTNFFKACPPSGRTADLFLSRVYGGHEGGRRRGGGYVVDFIYCLRSTKHDLWRASQSLDDTSMGTKKKAKQGKKRFKAAQAAAQKAAAAAAAAEAAAQAAAQAAQAAALGRYRLVNAWFYPRGDWYTFYWDGSSADKDPGPLAERIKFSIFGAERIRRDKREFSGRSSDDSSSDRDSCGTGSTSEANDIFDTLEDHLGYGSDSGSGW